LLSLQRLRAASDGDQRELGAARRPPAAARAAAAGARRPAAAAARRIAHTHIRRRAARIALFTTCRSRCFMAEEMLRAMMVLDTAACCCCYSYYYYGCTQSAPDRRFGKFRCAPRRIGLAGGDGRSTLK
jgi:hypothetical protein